MRRSFLFLSFLILLTACLPTRIVTVAPANTSHPVYGTVVTTPRTGVMTTTSCTVTPLTTDLSLYLDLQAVGAAFAQSSSIREFEALLNNTSYIISNLDLNGDGFVDYLRVLEQPQGTTHVFVIQAVLGDNIYQDVATLVAEVPSINSYYVQIIGAPYIYGPKYIIHPVFVSRPPIFSCFFRSGYVCWRSPWYWGHFPSYYKRPAPLNISHYQAYITTYMGNHRYCNKFEYANSYHYSDYGRVAQDLYRQDYEKMHPEKAFVTRTAEMAPAGTNSSIVNARDIRDRQAAATTSSTRSTSASTSPSASSRTSATASARSGASSSARSAASQASAKPASTSSSSSKSSTSSTSSSSRSSVSSSSRSSASSSSRSSASSSSSSTSKPSTTVKSSVRSSGTSSTKTTTVSPSGATSTSSRGSASSSSRSTSRSSSTSSSVSRSVSSTNTSSSRSSSAASSSRSSSSSSSGASSRSSASRSSR